MPIVPYIGAPAASSLYTAVGAGSFRVIDEVPFPTGVGKATLLLTFVEGGNTSSLSIVPHGETMEPALVIPASSTVTNQVGPFATVTSDVDVFHAGSVQVVVAWMPIYED